MYRYETHMHTLPVSACAKFDVKENLEFYKSLGYDGVFITNHFIDGNINIDKSLPYEELINFYFSDYEQAKALEKEIGINVFLGVEISYYGTDFIIIGLDKNWFLAHPEIATMEKSKELDFLRENGAFIIQAHPFRERYYIDHIRLFPEKIDAIEVINSTDTDFQNENADIIAERYNKLKTAGSDNHSASKALKLSGVETEIPLKSENDYVEFLKAGKIRLFSINRENGDK